MGLRQESQHRRRRAPGGLKPHPATKCRNKIPKGMKALQNWLERNVRGESWGNVRALARRMGIQGLVFDCHAWWAGMEEMRDYCYCYKRNGDPRHNLDRTQVHRNHVHIELKWHGAKKKTSFWRSPLS